MSDTTPLDDAQLADSVLPAGADPFVLFEEWFAAAQVGEINDLPYYRLIHPAQLETSGTMMLFAEVSEGSTVELFSGSDSSILHRAGRVAAAAANRLDECLHLLVVCNLAIDFVVLR